MRFFPTSTKITITLLSILIIQCSTKNSDDFCEKGFGTTTLKGHVLDSHTKKPVDSVEISIVSGASWDRFLDTLVKQDDSLAFTFNIPNDCEPYFVSLSNKHYLNNFENHPAYKVSINKGAINKFEISLKPATTIKSSIRRNILDHTPDTLFLMIKRENAKEWKTLNEVSNSDFSLSPNEDLAVPYIFSDSGTVRTIYNHYNIESNINYNIHWILSNANIKDTINSRFTAKPFDTVSLHYTFKKNQ